MLYLHTAPKYGLSTLFWEEAALFENTTNFKSIPFQTNDVRNKIAIFSI